MFDCYSAGRRITAFISFSSIFIAALLSYAKPDARGRISGRVFDAETGEPLPSVNVFLANTTLGDATNLDGNYLIQPVSSGFYDLVVSHIGYEFKTVRIQCKTTDSLTYDFKLKPKMLQAGQFQVFAPEARNWEDNLKRFNNIFIGGSGNVRRCEILNPTVLHFKYDSKDDELFASADSVLRIENRALGYRLYVILQSFRWRKDGGGYFAYIRFENMEAANEEQKNLWDENRKLTYAGSFRHFLCSLVRNRLKEDGYFLYSVLPSQFKYGRGAKFTAEELALLSPDSSPGLLQFRFENYLKVVYKRDVKSRRTEYIPDLLGYYPTSYIKLNQKYVLVDESGNLLDPLALIRYGAWLDERVGDLLPADYIPKPEY